MDIFKDQQDFMERCNQSTLHINREQKELYERLMNEEYVEFFEAFGREQQIKEAIDILVVTVGWLLSAGVDAAEAWRRVHESNLSKLTDGKIVRREDGKILKPDSYKAPDMSGL